MLEPLFFSIFAFMKSFVSEQLFSIQQSPALQFLFLFSIGKNTEAVVQRCPVKKVFLQMSQNSQENNCARVSFLIKLQADLTLTQVFLSEFCGICKNTFFQRTPLVAASKNS